MSSKILDRTNMITAVKQLMKTITASTLTKMQGNTMKPGFKLEQKIIIILTQDEIRCVWTTNLPTKVLVVTNPIMDQK